MEHTKFEVEFAGRPLVFETGKLATQATSSVVATYGQTMVLATTVISESTRDGIDYFPLLVDYEERMYAAGKISGSRFIKREGRPSDEAILTSRLVDRALRPLFPQDLRNDVQVVLTVLSVDTHNDPDIVSILAASAALHISSIPWDGPLACVRMGITKEHKTIINPNYEERAQGLLDITVASRDGKVVMLEAGAHQTNEKEVVAAIQEGVDAVKPIMDLLEEMRKKIGAPKVNLLLKVIAESPVDEETVEMDALIKETDTLIASKVKAELFVTPLKHKDERSAALSKIEKEVETVLLEKQVGKDKRKKLLSRFFKVVENEITRVVLEEGKRIDGRALDEVRPLTIEVGLLPRTHGSALFQRGDTQVLSVVTLGSPGDEQTLDGMEESGKKRYFHHYNFPPYSVGEVSPLRSPGRREIGHGALGERGLISVIPPKESFPYTIRVVSEVLGSNGSSSMASTCCSTLALMDAGVPITDPVAGVAMGLASDESGRYRILTDLQAIEDGEGGMDFKVSGTKKGITAVQMDTKTHGLTMQIVKETFDMAYKGRMDILSAMEKVIQSPRTDLSPFAPRIVSIQINPEKIRDVIGPGGKIINEIIQKTGVDIDIEQTGLVMITSENEEGMKKAVDWINSLVKDVVVGEVYKGKVTRIMDFGAFVEILPRQEGLVHISNLSNERVENVTDVVNIGDEVSVQVNEIDSQGRINLKIEGVTGSQERPHRDPNSSGRPHSGSRGNTGRGRPRY